MRKVDFAHTFAMKTIRLKSSFLVGLCSLLLFFSQKSGDLKQITKPYLGTYECESATLGVKEYMQDFAYIRLELKKDNAFTIYYKTQDGKKGEESGTYCYDEKTETITFQSKDGTLKREFPLKKGKLLITVPFASQALVMKFTQK